MVCPGCILSAATCAAACCRRTCASTRRVIENSILFERVDVGRHCRIRRAIIDKDVKIPPHRRSATTWTTTGSAASR